MKSVRIQDRTASEREPERANAESVLAALSRRSCAELAVVTDTQAAVLHLFNQLNRHRAWLTKQRLEVLFHLSRLWYATQHMTGLRAERRAYHDQCLGWAQAAADIEGWVVRPCGEERYHTWMIDCGVDEQGRVVEFDVVEWAGE